MTAKKPINTRIEADTKDRLDATVIGIKRLDPNYTLAQFVNDACAAWCAELEGRYNEGQPWAYEPGLRLPPGRPFGS